MRSILVALFLILSATPAFGQDKVILVIHGGAGGLLKKSMTPEIEKQYRDGLAARPQGRAQGARQDKGGSLDASKRPST